jgi:hypothetical protein
MAKQLAFEHLQASNVPFDRPTIPGKRHPCLEGGIALAESFGKASEGREGARSCTR